MGNRKFHEAVFDAVLFAFVPTVVYSMLGLRWLCDPFHMRQRIVRQSLPELTRFPSATSRFIAFHLARGGSVVVQGLIGLTGVALMAGLIHMARGHIHHRNGSSLQSWVHGTAVVILSLWIAGWMEILRVRLLPAPTRLALRNRLILLGLPTCLTCGGSLKGAEAGACPTCSEPHVIASILGER